MKRNISSELTKMYSSPIWLILGAVGLGLSALTIFSEAPEIGADINGETVKGLATNWMTMHLMVAIIAALMVTSEHSNGSIQRTVLLNDGSRGRMLATKGIAAIVGTLPLALVAAACAFSSKELFGIFWQVEGYINFSTWPQAAGVFAACMLSSVWGTAIGAIFRTNVVATIFLLATTLGFDVIVQSGFPEVGKYLFSITLGSLYEVPGTTENLSYLPGALVALAWIALASVISFLVLNRREFR